MKQPKQNVACGINSDLQIGNWQLLFRVYYMLALGLVLLLQKCLLHKKMLKTTGKIFCAR